MKYEFSERLQKLPPYLFAKLEEMTEVKRAQGLDIIDFGIGDPDLPTPQPIIKALQDAVADPANHNYSSSAGEKYLRKAVADWYKVRFNVDVDPNTEVCVTIGSKEGIFNISQAFVNPGEGIIAPSPGYPVYSGAACLFNEADAATVPLREDEGWLLNTDRCPKDAKMLYANYPNNPTGATCDLAYLKKVGNWCNDTDTIFCFDNAYSEMCFDGYMAPSALEVDKNCIEFGSLSKTFNMTGYRIAYAVGNRDLVAGLKKCKSQIDSGAPKFIQKAAATALSMYTGRELPDIIKGNMRTYGERREILVNGLRKLGFDVKMPKATFYIWFNCGMGSTKFCEDMLDLGIVVTPGNGFGKSADGYVRMTVTQPKERIKEALDRMRNR